MPYLAQSLSCGIQYTFYNIGYTCGWWSHSTKSEHASVSDDEMFWPRALAYGAISMDNCPPDWPLQATERMQVCRKADGSGHWEREAEKLLQAKKRRVS